MNSIISQEETEDIKKKNDQEEKRQQNLEKQRKILDKNLTELQKKFKSIIGSIKELAYIMKQAQDPNDDPMYLYGQVRPTLAKMKLNNKVQNNKTQILTGQVMKNKTLFKVILRREAEIDQTNIEKIKQNAGDFHSMKWSNAGIEAFIWSPYETPIAAPETAPAAPGAPS